MIKLDLQRLGLREKMYRDICQRLALLVDSNQKPVIESIDLWNNQWNYLEKEKVFGFPCVFIEFRSLPWTQLGGKQQQSSATIALHIGGRTNAASRWGNPQMDVALKHLRVIDAIHYVMSGWGSETGYMGSFTRILSENDHDHDDIIADVESYKVLVKDESAMPNFIKKVGDLFQLDIQ